MAAPWATIVAKVGTPREGIFKKLTFPVAMPPHARGGPMATVPALVAKVGVAREGIFKKLLVPVAMPPHERGYSSGLVPSIVAKTGVPHALLYKVAPATARVTAVLAALKAPLPGHTGAPIPPSSAVLSDLLQKARSGAGEAYPPNWPYAYASTVLTGWGRWFPAYTWWRGW